MCVWVLVSADKKAGEANMCLFSYDCGPGEVGEGGGCMVLSDISNLTVSFNGQDVRTGCRLQPEVRGHLALSMR